MRRYFRDLPIAWKLAAAPLVVLMCLLTVATVVLFALRQASGSTQLLVDVRLPRAQQAEQMRRNLTLVNSLLNRSVAWEGAGAKPEAVAQIDKAFANTLKQVDAEVAAAEKSGVFDAEMVSLWKKYASESNAALDMKSTALAMALQWLTTTESIYAKLDAKLADRAKAESAAASSAAGTVQSSLAGTITLAVALVAVALVIAGAVTWLFSRMISLPLTQAREVAERVALGDLTARQADTGQDATGRVVAALGDVTRNLSTMVTDIRSIASSVDHAAEEIASGNLDLSNRTEMQASNLQRTAEAVRMLSAACREAADGAGEAVNIAREATEHAGQGQQVVSEVITTMQSIQTDARRISEIIAVIDGIAFQTNILALNAAVESARAGEQGRGFAVVANEVRSLAGRSAQAAKEIRNLITSSVEQVESGTQRVTDAGVAMQRIVASIRNVHSRVDRIQAASQSQADGIAEVNGTVTQIEQATQQNAALVEQASAAALSLREQSQALVSAMGRFKVDAQSVA